MIYNIKHSLGQEKIWNLFTDNNFVIKWLAIESNINWKKNGKVQLTIIPGTHEITGCRIIDFQAPKKLSFTWKGPEEFDITMNFEDYLTHVEVIFQETALALEHKGWRSSEDWQEAKNWHEKVFWPEKIAKLTKLLDENNT